MADNKNEQIISNDYTFLEPYKIWLTGIIENISNDKHIKIDLLSLPKESDEDPIQLFFEEHKISDVNKVALIILLLDYYFPEIFLPILKAYATEKARLAMGGRISKNTRRYECTLKTIIFFLSGNDNSTKIDYTDSLNEVNNVLFASGIIDWKYSNDIGINSPITISNDFRMAMLGKKEARLDSGENFPARFVTTRFTFDEVILTEETTNGLQPLFSYLKVRKKIRQDEELSKLVKPCFLTVFSGFPGTGKTLAAKTIGKMFGMPTYTLELSRVVSKYIGEFEKSIDKVLTRLNGKDCILFIDEADSIFSKRLENVSDAKDKYVNQEMSYLLQRLEDYEGVIVLASNVANFKRQVDNAMLRRIRNIVQFSFPAYEQRLQLWQNALPKAFEYEESLLENLAKNYQLTGASIYNIVSDLIIYVTANNIELINFNVIKPFLEADYRKRDIAMQPCPDNGNPQTVMVQRVGKQVMTTGKRM